MEKGPDLKYLESVRVGTVRVVVFLVQLYERAKDGSGVLKPGLDRVEGLVQTVVGPVYAKVIGHPDKVFKFVDTKIDFVVSLVDELTPTYIKKKVAEAYGAAKATPQKLEKTGESLFETAKHSAYFGWKAFLVLPLAPQVVKFSVPLAVHASVKYNDVADYLKFKTNPTVKAAAAYLPIIPVHELEKTVKADLDAALKVKKTQ